MKKLWIGLTLLFVVTLSACDTDPVENGNDNNDDNGDTVTVTFLDHDDSEIDSVEIDHGEDAAEPDAPTRSWHVFDGWDASLENITEDTTIYATYLSLDDMHPVDAAKYTANEIDSVRENTRIYLNEVFEQENTFSIDGTDFAFISENQDGTRSEAVFHDDGETYWEKEYIEETECYDVRSIGTLEYYELMQTHHFNYMVPEALENAWFSEDNGDYVLESEYYDEIVDQAQAELVEYRIDVSEETIHILIELDDGSQVTTYDITYDNVGDNTVNTDVESC